MDIFNFKGGGEGNVYVSPSPKHNKATAVDQHSDLVFGGWSCFESFRKCQRSQP